MNIQIILLTKLKACLSYENMSAQGWIDLYNHLAMNLEEGSSTKYT